MIDDDQQIEELKKIALNLYIANIEMEYGERAVDITEMLTNQLSKIYSFIDIRNYNHIVVIKSLNGTQLTQEGINYKSTEEFSQINEDELFVEILDEGNYRVQFDIPDDVKKYTDHAIVYEWESKQEYFYIRNERDHLSKLSSLDSYFIKPTFKELDSAINSYKTEQALNSSCVVLRKNLWKNDSNRIIFIAGPESVMRDSLHQHLRSRLRGNKEVLREQNVSVTKPIDIRVTWGYTNHVALIEIKWIGLSASGTGYEEGRAITRSNKGAKQLADYLDMFATESPTKTTRGYLVVFDGRRKSVDENTTSINQIDGLFYQNSEIEFDPEFHKKRSDFEEPIRFFLKPICD